MPIQEFYISSSGAGPSSAESDKWREPQDNQEPYRVHLCTLKEDDGTYSTIVLNLPGAGSCGDTKEESKRNAIEALKGILALHKESGEAIPWKDSTADKRDGADQVWIIVHALPVTPRGRPRFFFMPASS